MNIADNFLKSSENIFLVSIWPPDFIYLRKRQNYPTLTYLQTSRKNFNTKDFQFSQSLNIIISHNL